MKPPAVLQTAIRLAGCRSVGSWRAGDSQAALKTRDTPRNMPQRSVLYKSARGSRGSLCGSAARALGPVEVYVKPTFLGIYLGRYDNVRTVGCSGSRYKCIDATQSRVGGGDTRAGHMESALFTDRAPLLGPGEISEIRRFILRRISNGLNVIIRPQRLGVCACRHLDQGDVLGEGGSDVRSTITPRTSNARLLSSANYGTMPK